jgi:DNA-binding NarL/FixJ family response regulator
VGRRRTHAWRLPAAVQPGGGCDGRSAVCSGRHCIAASNDQPVAGAASGSDGAEAYALSPREQEVTRLIARGAGTAEIAATLFVSPHTVRDYVKTIFDKVGVSSRGEPTAKFFAEHYTRPLHEGCYHVDGE